MRLRVCRWVRRAALGVLALGLAAPGCTGSEGELGQEHFAYQCVADGDPYCDIEVFDPTCGAGCTAPFRKFDDEDLPPAVARGSRFMVVADPRGLDQIIPISSAPSILEYTRGEFVAVEEGEVAVIAFEGSWAKDFAYITIVEAADIRVDLFLEDGTRADAVDRQSNIKIEVWDRFFLRAVPVDDLGEVLYGAFPCSWSTDDASTVDLASSPLDNIVELSADATGNATLAVTLGAFSADVAVRVLDATQMGGGAP